MYSTAETRNGELSMSELKTIMSRLDANAFCTLDVVAAENPMVIGSVTATVLYSGYPVALVSTDGDDDTYGEYRFASLFDEHMQQSPKSSQAQAYAGFLLEIGTINGEQDIADWIDGRITFDEMLSERTDDGHAWVGFLGEVAHAIYAAFPAEAPEPTGF
jgi:hypothetical protein